MGTMGVSCGHWFQPLLGQSSLQPAIHHHHRDTTAPCGHRGTPRRLFLPINKTVLPQRTYLQYALAVGALLSHQRLGGFLALTVGMSNQAAQRFNIHAGVFALVDTVL